MFKGTLFKGALYFETAMCSKASRFSAVKSRVVRVYNHTFFDNFKLTKEKA